MYDSRHLTRYVIELALGLDAEPREAIIDTACSTTLIPLKYAKKHGTKLNHKGEIVVGGYSYDANLYLFTEVSLGNFAISKLVAFAADYRGSIADRILLGNNVLYNFAMELYRNQNGRLKFEYRPWHLVSGRKHPCVMFFRTRDASPLYPSELIME